MSPDSDTEEAFAIAETVFDTPQAVPERFLTQHCFKYLTMGPDECEDCCSTCCCFTVGSICCCRPMTKNTRIKILWAWLLVLSMTSAIILGCAVYSPFKLLASPTDMIPIRNHVHFLFCEEVEIVSPGLQFNGYIISGNLEIDQTKTKQDSQKTALFINERTYEYFAFYFLERSTVVLKHCAKSFLSFTVIVGKSNFDIWKQYQYCDDCYFEKSFLQPAGNCVGAEQYSKYILETIVEDEYYIIYSNDNYQNVWVDLNIALDRTVYDLQNSTTACTDSTQCNIILDGPDETALVWVMDYNYNLGQNSHAEFSIKCVPRIWAYLLLHGFPVLLIGICFSVLIQKTCRDPDNIRFNIRNENTPLLHNGDLLPPSYSAVLREPPKYEDIFRTSEPPPYTEVLAGLETAQHTTTDHTSLESDDVFNGSISSLNLQNVHEEYRPVFNLESTCNVSMTLVDEEH